MRPSKELKTKPPAFGKDELKKLKEISQGIHASLPAGFVRLSGLFLAELLKWNKTINLISRRDVASVIDKHFFDSLGLLCVENDLAGKRILDVGSGAGFPGIVLAAWEPKAQILLVESRAKKVAFLKNVRRILGLDNVRVLHLRVENLNRAEPPLPPIDVIVSRGVKGVSNLVISLAEILAERGLFVFYKGPGALKELRQGGECVKLGALGFDVELATPPWQRRTTLVTVRKASIGRPIA